MGRLGESIEAACGTWDAIDSEEAGAGDFDFGATQMN